MTKVSSLCRLGNYPPFTGGPSSGRLSITPAQAPYVVKLGQAEDYHANTSIRARAGGTRRCWAMWREYPGFTISWSASNRKPYLLRYIGRSRMWVNIHSQASSSYYVLCNIGLKCRLVYACRKGPSRNRLS